MVKQYAAAYTTMLTALLMAAKPHWAELHEVPPGSQPAIAQNEMSCFDMIIRNMALLQAQTLGCMYMYEHTEFAQACCLLAFALAACT